MTKIDTAANCSRCSGSGEDPEGYVDQSRGPDGATHDGPCRDCHGTGEHMALTLAKDLEYYRAAGPLRDCMDRSAAELRRLHAENAAQAQQIAQDRADAARPDSVWCQYVAGIICTYLKEDADGPKSKAIAGIIERRLCFAQPRADSTMKEKTP